MPARPIAIELIGGRGHYERVIGAVLAAHTSVWIATANVKELLVEDGRAVPGRRRNHRRGTYVSVLAHLDQLAARGIELRLLHAELPSRPFREALARYPRLVAGGLALARCPRVHLKLVIVDGALLYLGSANWTGAGLGAKGSGRRNFELGVVTDDGPLLDQIQSLYEQLWRGAECEGCRLRDECPGPLAEMRASGVADKAQALAVAENTPRALRRGHRTPATIGVESSEIRRTQLWVPARRRRRAP
ncbi:MAG: phospholipase D family protein [Kofleriaceae bacterium]